eukprot:TRINITY_DN53132_c0_g1_i1.p1 TRINITY_DN53132_c0_g1~~TRINITY_DN53132_c0_g1_i1.p1  ORF type:complete len:382 (+),score=128.93 TRINITY_DN53132_c0_g1_i1:73-1218(+)
MSGFDSEKRALRNTALTGVLLSAISAARGTRRKRADSTSEPRSKLALPSVDPLGRYEEAYMSAAGVGCATEVYGVMKSIVGRPIAGVASLVPLKMFMNDARFKANYKFLVAYAAAQILISKIPQLQRHPILLMMASTGQLLTWWLLSDTALPRSYMNFLYDQGKICRDRVMEVRRLTYEQEEDMTEYKQFIFPKPEGGQYPFEADSLFQMVRAMLGYWTHHMKGSVPFYCKIYALRFIVLALSGRSKAQVSTRLTGLIRDILRSSVFLSSYCTQAYISLIILMKLFPRFKCNPIALWSALTLPGLSLLIETPSQQRTIANYCATFGIYPVLEHFGLFDVVGGAAALVAGMGEAKTPLPLYLIWGEDPAMDRRRQAVRSKHE